MAQGWPACHKARNAACSTPPEGYSRWSLRLLERHVALVEDLPDLDHSTIGRVLKNETASSSEEVLDDPTDRLGRGAAASQWMSMYHSAQRIVALQCRAYRNLLAGQW